MIQSLALDALLVVILIAIIPLGMYRGGVREVCTSAGLLLGVLMAQQWSERWGNWVADITGIDAGVAKFIVAIATVVLTTSLIGYGAAASFSHRPGPGGRLFGGLLALVNAVIFLGALIQFVADDLYDGVYPAIIQDGYVSRALSQGFDWVLLAVTACVVLGILFGMVVRERDVPDEEVIVPASTGGTSVPVRTSDVPVAKPLNDPEAVAAPSFAEAAAEPAPPIRIKEVRHWEEPVPSTLDELQSGWTRTWPTTVTSSETTTPRRSGRGQRPDSVRRPSGGDQDVVRDWLSQDRGSSSDE